MLVAGISWLFPIPLLFRQSQQPVFRWLITYHLLCFLTEAAAQLLIISGISPNYAANIYNLISPLPIGMFFYFAIGRQSLWKAFVAIFSLCSLFALTNAFFLQKSGPNYYSITSESILIITACIAYLYKLLNDPPDTKLYREPLFIIICAWFMTVSGKLVITVISPYLFKIMKDNMLVMWYIFNGLTIAGNLTITYGAYLQHRRSKAINAAIQ